MVSSNADPSGGHRELQHLDRIGALVHEVADENQQVVFAFAFVTTRIVFELLKELPELGGAAVDVADDDDSPLCKIGFGVGVEDGVDDRREREAFSFFF